MELHNWITAIVAFLGLVSGLFSYILGLRIQNSILKNNKKIDKDIEITKEKIDTDITALRTELMTDCNKRSEKVTDILTHLERELSELGSNLNDRILNVVNGKYVRSDLHNQTILGIQQRFDTMKELIEMTMDKIEKGLDRQISDLKDRISNVGS